MRRPGGFRKARARAARRSLREKNLAWTESQAVHQGNYREASRLASRTRPAQHLGSDAACRVLEVCRAAKNRRREARSEEHTSELQSRLHLVCRLLLEKKKKREPAQS